MWLILLIVWRLATFQGYVKQGKKNFVIVPIAFVNDHIETLHELDIEYCKDLMHEVCTHFAALLTHQHQIALLT